MCVLGIGHPQVGKAPPMSESCGNDSIQRLPGISRSHSCDSHLACFCPCVFTVVHHQTKANEYCVTTYLVINLFLILTVSLVVGWSQSTDIKAVCKCVYVFWCVSV